MQCSHKILILCLALLIATGLQINPAFAVEADKSSTEPGQLAGDDLLQPTEDFEYQFEGRPDPFTPFIADKATSQKIGDDELIEEEGELTGMRQFEPGQLTLVAVMFTGGKKVAMVEDVTGRGYMINEGMLIGRRGIVHRIDGEQVTVMETAHTRAGRKIENKIVMRLNKEGDQ